MLLATTLLLSGVLAAPPLVITHVRVVPMDRETVLDDRSVVIVDGRITRVAPSADVTIEPGAQVIDGAGKWLLPGLADMHVHAWVESDLTLFVANGVTTVRNMFGSPMHVEWRDAIAAGTRFGPRIYTAGPIIDGSPPVWPGSTVLTDPADADDVVVEQQEAGYDFLKCYSKLSADAFDALAAAGKKHGMRMMGHVPPAVTIEHAIEVGQESIEHFTGLVACCQTGDSPVKDAGAFQNESIAWKHVDDAKITAVAKSCAAHGAWNCPTIVVMQKWAKGKDADDLLARPEMRYVDPQIKWYWSSPMMYLAKMPDEVLAASHAADADRLHALSLFHAAGAPLLAGTDMGNPYVVAGWSLHEELANFVAAGCTPFEALKAATSDAAKFMHAEQEWGTIAEGRVADLVLLDANPLADVKNAARTAGVVVRGAWHPQSELHEMLEKIAAAFPTTPGEKSDGG